MRMQPQLARVRTAQTNWPSNRSQAACSSPHPPHPHPPAVAGGCPGRGPLSSSRRPSFTPLRKLRLVSIKRKPITPSVTRKAMALPCPPSDPSSVAVDATPLLPRGNSAPPCVSVIKEPACHEGKGIVIDSKTVQSSSRLQQYAQRGMIRLAPVMHAPVIKRRCTGNGEHPASNSQSIFKRKCDVLNDGPRKRGRPSSSCLVTSCLVRPPEGISR